MKFVYVKRVAIQTRLTNVSIETRSIQCLGESEKPEDLGRKFDEITKDGVRTLER